jgi:ParB family chromosome partitioning protein
MKRDLAFIVEALLHVMDEPRLAMIARNRGIRSKEGESVGRLLAGVLRKADESELVRALVEIVILLSARSQSDSGKVLRTAAQAHKVDADAIALKVKQEFAAKDKAKKPVKTVVSKQVVKGKKAA